MPNPNSLADFIRRWQHTTLNERQGAQRHFDELCYALGYDPHDYSFEERVTTSGGRRGFADVWRRDFFALEYKSPGEDLQAAYQQLKGYSDELYNPPLLVVSDMTRYVVRTNFTNTRTDKYEFTLDDLRHNAPTATCALPPLEVLRAMFERPALLLPGYVAERVTTLAAAEFAAIAENQQKLGADPHAVAHFLMRVLFCLFAEDIGLLPKQLFTNLVSDTRDAPRDFRDSLSELFSKMASGGRFGGKPIAWFNGGLFTDGAALLPTGEDMRALERAAHLDWANVEPAIFGTLFERSLDPAKRAQLGAHYTHIDDIKLIVEPVLMAPLRRHWRQVQAEAAALIGKRDAASGAARDRQQAALNALLQRFASEIAATRVLDPACGSGNFLYVALRSLLDIEHEVDEFAANNSGTRLLPQVGPQQLYGIEVNTYAYELASVVVWIGYIQWRHEHAYPITDTPILRRLDNIRQMDAIMTPEGSEPQWPEVDVIIGNPPFLGDKKMRGGLGSGYVDDLRQLYANRVPGGADLVTYWFERARERIKDGKAKRAGLIATQSVRVGANREVLKNIKVTGDIFMAWSDRPWVLDGAAVRVSIVGFDNRTEQEHTLNGTNVAAINPDLTGALDLTKAVRLKENAGIAFIGTQKGGDFDISYELAQQMIRAKGNPNGRSNSDVVKPWLNGSDATGRPQHKYIIFFGINMSEAEAALYEAPFEYAKSKVKNSREAVNSEERSTLRWWLHQRPRPNMWAALQNKARFIVSPRVAKHRVFIWADIQTVPDSRLLVIARDDGYFFGALHSRIHEVWSLHTSPRHGVGNDPTYNAESCFETFPFPYPPGSERQDDPKVQVIAEAAKRLVELRDNWLNPAGATEAELKQRTLTNLYNERPTWLQQAHRKLDEAVLAAYGWPADISDEEILARLLALNIERSRADASRSNPSPASAYVNTDRNRRAHASATALQ